MNDLVSIVGIESTEGILSKYPMLRLLRDIITKYPDVTVTPCNHWYKTKDGLDVLSGYHVTFANTYTLSVQFGFGNYTNNYPNHAPEPHNLTQDYYLKQAIDAEIAVIENETGTFKYFVNWGNSVNGWQTPEQIIEFVDGFFGSKPVELNSANET